MGDAIRLDDRGSERTMSLGNHLATKVVYDDNVFIVEDDRNTGESDADFCARHGRHILAVMTQYTILSLETTSPYLVTDRKGTDPNSDTVALHVWALLN